MEQYEAYEKIRTAKTRNDLIGAIFHSEVCDRMFDDITPGREKEPWGKFMESLAAVADEKEADNISSLAMYYGNSREETGFRMGFHVAMRLCMEGLNGGAVL